MEKEKKRERWRMDGWRGGWMMNGRWMDEALGRRVNRQMEDEGGEWKDE